MKISVKVKLHAKEEKIEKIDDDNFVVWTKELPIESRANEAIIRVLADYFNVPKANISIISGFKSRRKTIEII
jgi:uncharacterized protein YggU (UPF0235/DUF167 family)